MFYSPILQQGASLPKLNRSLYPINLKLPNNYLEYRILCLNNAHALNCEWEYGRRLDNPTSPQNKHLYVLKSVGLGLSTLLLRYIAWKCVSSNIWSGGRVCILTAPRIDLTIDLVKRLKALFPTIVFKERDTVCTLNNVTIEAFPSHLGLKGMRGLTDIRMILCDEASFFDLSQVQEARETIERYWAKNNPIIVLCSTPNRPNDLMDQIRQEPEDQCIYKRLYLS